MNLNPNYRYLIIDTETTGLSTEDDDIIQVGLIVVDHEWNITDRFSHYVQPEHFSADQLKPLIQHITGIDPTLITSAPPLSQLWDQMGQYFGEDVIVIGHNISFDLAMLGKHHKLVYADTIDTMDVARTLLHYQRSYALEILHQQLMLQPRYRGYLDGIELHHHDALSDCYTTYALLRYGADRVDEIIVECPTIKHILADGQWSCYLGADKSDKTRQIREESAGDVVPLRKGESKGNQIVTTVTRKDFGFEPYSAVPNWSYKSKGVIVDEQGNIVVATVQKAHNGMYEYYDLPGGTRETGETDQECLTREVLEETGYTITSSTLLGVVKCYYNDSVGCDMNGFIAYVTGSQGIISLTEREQQEGVELKYMQIDDVIDGIKAYISDSTNSVLKSPYIHQKAFLQILYRAKEKITGTKGVTKAIKRGIVSLPSLKAPVATPKTMVDHEFYDWTGLASTSKIGLEHAGFTAALLRLVHPHRKMIVAFAHRAKLDLAKKILADHGITGLGYMRENQYIDPAQLKLLGAQGQRDHDEVSRMLKYSSHYLQGLSVLDHNTPGDFKVYQRVRLHRDDGEADIILSTHAGVYAALQDNTYPDHAVLFRDHQWWLSTAQKFYQSGVRIDHLLNMIEGTVYKLRHTSDVDIQWLTEFQGWREVLWGVFGSQLITLRTQLPHNSQGRIELIGGLPWDQMHQFTALYSRKDDYFDHLFTLLSVTDKVRISRIFTRLDTLLHDGCQIELQTNYQGDNIIISPASTYVDYADFRQLFAGRHVIFAQTAGQGTDNITTKLVTHPPTRQITRIADLNHQAGQRLYIIQSSRNHCKSTFDTLMKQGLNKTTLLMGENVTGGGNKLIEQARGSKSYVMVGGYDLYMQTLAAQIPFDEVIVIGSLGVLHDQIVRDVEFYAS